MLYRVCCRAWAPLWVCCALVACAPKEESNQELTETESLSPAEKGIERVVYSLPSPTQVVALLKQSGARYEKGILNPDAKASRYTASHQQALNLGVYGADLAFASAFGQNQDAIRYYLAVQKVATPLGLSSVFTPELLRRVEAQKTQPDSLSALAATVYRKSNARLKANGQDDIAALILVGGWVEGLYLATQLYQLAPSEALAQQIVGQKLAYENVAALLGEAKPTENKALAEVLASLKAVETAFAPVGFDYSLKSITTDSTRRMTRIDNASKATYTTADLAAIARATAETRNLIVR